MSTLRSDAAEIVFDHVIKRYAGSERPAVDDLSLTIPAGEICVLIGPSGGGKTTRLRMVAGLETPTGGEIYIGDRLVNFTAPKDRDVAMVFQNYALYPQMDVTDNITLGLRLHHTPKGTIRPAPRRSVRRPAIGIAVAAPSPCGASSRPASSALSWRASW